MGLLCREHLRWGLRRADALEILARLDVVAALHVLAGLGAVIGAGRNPRDEE